MHLVRLHDQNLAAIVRFTSDIPTQWVHGRTGPGVEEEGYPVDSGTGCFCDESAAALFGDARLAALELEDGATLVADAGSGAHIVCFRTGQGDALRVAFLGGTLDATAALTASNRVAGKSLKEISERYPRPARVDVALAKQRGVALVDPHAEVRSADKERGQALANAIRALVPVAPPVEAFLKAYAPTSS